ncbi:nitric oxide synthase oxygenase [Deinococcus sp. YIM 77859]|uniref:nitric oxide synthase oxygenase n=1 Tax=Deinococcus sp. YIM 77859 TaxID=1540221 RepID=UPI000554E484|nr:nitric oxide synthase oxygenase [Deinococcus sp. YIM 77859]
MTAAFSQGAPPARLLAEAERFLTLYHDECRRPGLAARLSEVRDEVARTGSYTLTSDELTHGARVAWRNSSRCVGRLPWAGLEVRDLRHVTRPDDVFAFLLAHLHGAFNGGRVRPLVSVFGPGVRIHNDQLLRYAGYRHPDGTVTGDPQNVSLTSHLRRLGWTGGPGTPFDVLPLAVEGAGQVRLYELPPDAAPQVPLTHPDCPAIADLGLRWFALPVLSGFALEVGGLTFSCAPLSGWYVQTEIAARNLADEGRYNALPAVARALGLEMASPRRLWQDRALVELNVAVLHSFDAAGVRISDHHSVARQFVQFEAREAQAGREVRGRWSWLIPPLSPATTPIWHRQYVDGDERPAYLPQLPAWAQREGAAGCPFHG